MSLLRVLAALLLCTTAVFAADLKILTDNKTISGELVSINDKEIVIKTPGGNEATPLQQVLYLELQQAVALPAGTAYHQVELTDGSLLNCKTDGITFNGKNAELVLLGGQKVTVPITGLSYVLKDAHDPKNRDNAQWKTILKGRRNNDMLVKWFQGQLNGLDGTFGDGKESSIDFTFGTRMLSIDIKNQTVQGLIFVNKPDPNAPLVLCKLFDMHNDQLVASKVEAKEGDVEVTLVAGGKVQFPRTAVAKLDYSKGKREFLSDLDMTVIEEPGEDRPFDRPRRDKNLDNGALQLGGKRFNKGLSLCARTVLDYKLGGDYKEFDALVGVDETVAGKSHVRLLIEGDGKQLFSAEFTRKDKPREVRLNIQNVQTLRISVLSVEALDFANHLDLADVKISK